MFAGGAPLLSAAAGRSLGRALGRGFCLAAAAVACFFALACNVLLGEGIGSAELATAAAYVCRVQQLAFSSALPHTDSKSV